jgi:hypothetical protein
MEEIKPNQTNPSTEETPEVQIMEPTELPAVAERIKEAVESQKPKESVVEESSAEAKGGTGSDVSESKDSSDTNPNAEVLKLLGDITGRNYGDIEEAKKHVTNLESLVGDKAFAEARKAKTTLDGLVSTIAAEEKVTKEEAYAGLESLLTGTQKTEPDQVQPEAPASTPVPEPSFAKEASDAREQQKYDAVTSELSQLKESQQKFELLTKYPESQGVQEEIIAVAKQKGIHPIEAYEGSFKALVEAKRAEESRNNPVVTPSNKIGFDQKKVQSLGAKVIKGDSIDDKEALVAETLGLN